jgi:cysteate synthase
MLYINGGGEEKFKRENEIIYLKPKHVFDSTTDAETAKEVLDKMF